VLADASSSLGGVVPPDPGGTRHLHPPLPDDGATFRLDLGNGQHIQIIDDATAHPEARVATIPLGIEGFDRIEAVQRFLSALHGRAIPPDTRLTRQQRDRHRRMLRAFDGTRAGATQQEIAEVLFEIGRLTRDQWQASADRHRIKTLLRDARSMIAGGYRKLLRHRRKS
jgi:hypothetical protein